MVGGDHNHPTGPFRTALDLLLTGVLAKHGIRRIGLACYPEAHRKVEARRLDEALDAKLALAGQQGLECWLVTEFCLEAAPVLAFLRRLRARRIRAPVRIGIAGPTDRRTLWKHALHRGIGGSIRTLGDRPDIIHDPLIRETPDALVANLAAELADPVCLGVAGLHFFAFGGIEAAIQWGNAAGRCLRSDADRY